MSDQAANPEQLSAADLALQTRLQATVTWSERRGPDPTLPDELVQVGQYLSGTVWRRTFRLSDVPCPYCGDAMREALDAEPARIVRILHRASPQRTLVMDSRIPDTHRAFGCETCHVQFTMPKADPVLPARPSGGA